MVKLDITTPLAQQLAASLDMLETAVERSSDNIWIMGEPPFWQIAFHANFYVDFYLSTFDPEITNPAENYRLPEYIQKFAGKHYLNESSDIIVPKEVLTKFLGHTRNNLKKYFADNIGEQLSDPSDFEWLPMNKYELILYNIRHVMEHVAMLNQILKKNGLDAAGWLGIREL